MSGPRPAPNFKSPIINWIDYRLPIFTMMDKEYGQFPMPKNLNYFWNFGAIAMFMLVTMIASGVVLAMNYTPHAAYAFDSVERVMRDVNSGWLIRYIHMNGASFFFIAVYIHIWRGMYYGSYKQPRELLWILGVTIYLLMMATAFMGYVLPWGQMSFWGATVITNFFTAIPLVGDSITTWLWGGFAVDNPTLNRFFALHYLLPFVIFAVVILHVAALHIHGSNNPLGIDVKGPQDTIPFNPYYTVKDVFGLLVFIAFYAAFVFWMPDALGHPDNYIPADPLVTPAHIVPEWYFLPFYAILRAVTFDLGLPVHSNLWMMLVVGAGAVLAALAAFAIVQILTYRALGKLAFVASGVAAVVAFFGVHYVPYIGAQVIDAAAATELSKGFALSVTLITAKLGGVIAMFGAVGLLFVLPWLDTHPVRSARFRPMYRAALFGFLFAVLVLGYVGAKPAEGIYVVIGQVATLYYFAFFLVILPFLSKFEKAKPLPTSIAEAVLKKGAVTAAVLLALVSFAPSPAHAAKSGELVHREWPHQGVLGTYDRAALQRGFQVYKEVCSACHAMKHLSYRNLEALGFSEDEVKAIASGYMVTDGPNEEGEMFERPAIAADRFKSPFANKNAARAANNGAYPADLSLIVKARGGHEDYIYSLLTGYADAPAGVTLMPGMNYNKAFPGGQIAMAAPLMDGGVTYADGTVASIDQMAQDVTQFLTWAGDPHMEDRKRTGVAVMLFLLVFAGIMYAAKKKMWGDVQH